MHTTPEQTAARLDLDEREVLSRKSGTLLPHRLGRAQWGLMRQGILVEGQHRQVIHTPQSRELSQVIEVGLDSDELPGWGIQFRGRGEECWWGPDCKGYVMDISKAGLYTHERAAKQHGGERCNSGGDHVVPPPRMLELVDADLDKTREKLARLEAMRAILTGEATAPI